MNLTREIVYYDMDGVLANFVASMAEILPGVPMGDGPDYEERSKLVHEACKKHPHIFLDLPVIPGAIESVLEVMEHYDVLFLSTPMEDVPESFTDKFLWLKKHFGEKASRKLVLSSHKDLSLGAFLIDDTTRYGAGDFTGTHIHFGTPEFPYHKSVTDYLLSPHIFRYAA